MKKCFIAIIFLIISTISAQQVKTVSSKVVGATVFKDRAMVTRESKVNLASGKQQVIISNLTANLRDETVRVSATGPAVVKILDVKVERRFTTEFHQKNIQALQSKIDSMKRIVQEAKDEISVLYSKKDFIESLKAEALKYANERILLNSSSTKNWGEMLQFVEKNLNNIYGGLREQNQKKDALELEINKIQLAINNAGNSKTQSYKEIIVNLDNEQTGNVILTPSYIVENASWYPVYDARVITESKQMELDYFGMIQQSTGEDWDEINLTLSTAEPLSVKSLPNLDSWYLDVRPLPVKWSNKRNPAVSSNYEIKYDINNGYPAGKGALTGYVIDKSTGERLTGVNVFLEGTIMGSVTDLTGKFFIANVPQSNYNLKVTMIGYVPITTGIRIMEKQIANIIIPMDVQAVSTGEIMVIAQQPGVVAQSSSALRVTTNDDNKINYTNVFAKELSTTFEIPVKNSIPSDNSPHKVTIAKDILPIEFSYTTAPKVVPKVYLKGKAINTNNYPLLEGGINVFVDNDFINKTSLNNVVPTDTIELALGTDDKIKVEKKLINKFVESKGLFGGSKLITYDYEIRISNNRTTEESISVVDQLPIAMNEEIKVNLLKPDKESTQLKNDQKIEWNIRLKPGENKILPFSYSVEFPNNINIYGLE